MMSSRLLLLLPSRRRLLVVVALCSFVVVDGFSAAVLLDNNRNALAQTFSSPSGKLTFSPELVVKEPPTDPTAYLLHGPSVVQLSSALRQGKANAAFVRASSLDDLRAICDEQESARGNFPGPVPVVYCPPPPNSQDDKDEQQQQYSMADIASSGAAAVLVSLQGQVASIEDFLTDADEAFTTTCQSAIDAGLEPIPELCLAKDSFVGGEEVVRLVDTLIDKGMNGHKPVCIVLSVPAEALLEQPEDDDEAIIALPSIPKSLIRNRGIAVLGSVSTPAGNNRLDYASRLLKQAGFAGALLRHASLGKAAELDLEVIGQFWSHCVSELKSTKSKAFNFRSKNNMEKSGMSQWGSLQQSIMDSGALGNPEDNASIAGALDMANGDYQGF